ncbi:MAG: hypothetical protein ACYS6Z_00675 [Planctomycetota bacterium]|jgi:hypothetical protein
MNGFLRLCGVPLLALATVLAGCGGDDQTGDKHDEMTDEMTTEHGSGSVDAEAFKGLSAADQVLAKAQGTCPVSDEPLGSMGTPIKVTHGDKTVFLCCKGCEKKFHRDAATYIAKVEKRSK